MVLFYNQDHEKLGDGNIEPLWHGPYVVKFFLKKGAHELMDCDGNPLFKPCNELYLKIYYT